MATDNEKLQDHIARMLERGRAFVADPAGATMQSLALLRDPVQAMEAAQRTAMEMADFAMVVGRLAFSALPFGPKPYECGCGAAAEPVAPPPPAAAPADEPEAAFAEEPAEEPAAADEDEPAEPAAAAGPDEEQPGRDQLYKVARVLYDEARGEGRYLTAREIAEAATAAGLSILPGNVRKILRTRAARHVEARLRAGETGKVTEFRLGARGRSWFEKTYPVH